MRQLVIAFDDDIFIRGKSSFDDEVIARFRTRFHETLLHDAVPAHDEDIGAALLDNQGLLGNHDRPFEHVEQQFDLSELSGEQDMVGIGHLGPHGEGTRLGIDQRIGEIDQSPIGILRPVGQRDRNIGVPLAGRILMAQIDVTGLATQVIQRGHTEIDPHRIALYHGGQQRLAARTDERTDIGVPLGNVTRNGRLHGRVAEYHFSLRKVGFAHHHVRHSALVGGDGVIQVELTGGILLIQRTNTVQVALGLQSLGPGFVQLRLGLVRTGAIDRRVDDEKRLALLNIGSLGKEHLLQITFDAGPDLDELLGPDTAHVLAIDADIFDLHRFDGHHRQSGGLRPGTQQHDEQNDQHHDGTADEDPVLTSQFHPNTRCFGRYFFQFLQIQLFQIRFHFISSFYP